MQDIGIVLSVKELEDRYQLSRSNIYNRVNSLKAKGYDMEPRKMGTRSFFDGSQVEVMDRLHDHLRQGEDLASYPGVDGRLVLPRPIERPVECPVGHSTETATNGALDLRPGDLAIDALAAAIVLKLEPITREPAATSDPLASLRVIQETSDRGWRLSTNQLAPLLGLKNLPGKTFSRYGFRFTRCGRNGSQSAWLIEKDAIEPK